MFLCASPGAGYIEQEKFVCLGVFPSEVEAARSYDRAQIAARGIHALTNFPLEQYLDMLGE